MARKRVAKPVDNTKAAKESGKVPLIPSNLVRDILGGLVDTRALFKDTPLSFTMNFTRVGTTDDGLPSMVLTDVVEKQLADHRSVEELVAKVANRLVSQPHWSTLGVAPPDLDLTVECLTMMLDYAPHGFGRRDLEWLVDVADDQQVRYNVLGFMRFLDLETGELNLDVGTGFTPQYVR